MLPKGSKVYISGPYSSGNIIDNVAKAVHVAHILIDLGYYPYCPHLNHFIHVGHPKQYETWMDQDLNWVTACDAIFRLPGESPGADREVEFAHDHSISEIPVYTDFAEMTGVELPSENPLRTALETERTHKKCK